jgi:hypothetical protein
MVTDMKWAALIFVLMVCRAEAADEFPLTSGAWERFQKLKSNRQFYTSCFAEDGPAGDLAAVISEAHATEGPRLAQSVCTRDTPVTPEDIFDLGMMYCQHKQLSSDWAAIEKALDKCLGRGSWRATVSPLKGR